MNKPLVLKRPAPLKVPTEAPLSTPAKALPLRSRLGDVELRRRMWHMAPGLLPILSWLVPHRDPLSFTFKMIAASIIVGIAAALVSQYHTIIRRGERNWGPPVLGYAGSVLGMLLLFPAHGELGMTVLVVLAFGDGTATLCGRVFSSAALPWNPNKTWAGFLAFIGFGIPLASLAYLAESQPRASVLMALTCGSIATLAAAIAESLPWRINDNIRVGLAASVAVTCTHYAMMG